MSIKIDAYTCEKCGKAWLLKEKADDCCKEKEPRKCRVCGKKIEPPYLICCACKTKERYEKAKKIKYSEYKIGCLWDEHMEQYFYDKEELMEAYLDQALEKGEQPIYPEWCFGCVEKHFKINIDAALEFAEEDMYDEFDRNQDLVDLKELYDFIEQWNKRQSAKAYYMDYTTVVLLNA